MTEIEWTVEQIDGVDNWRVTGRADEWTWSLVAEGRHLIDEAKKQIEAARPTSPPLVPPKKKTKKK